MKGRLLTVQSAEALERISYYLNTDLPKSRCKQEDGDETALLCGAGQAEGATSPDWSAEQWTEIFAPTEVHAAREAMSYFGRLTPVELARLRPGLLARAASSARAETGTA